MMTMVSCFQFHRNGEVSFFVAPTAPPTNCQVVRSDKQRILSTGRPFFHLQRLLLFCCLFFSKALCFSPSIHAVVTQSVTSLSAQQTEPAVELQSDETLFGRGDFHLSASLYDDDVVVYQTGTWTVDGVQVGDGTPADWEYARVENLQIVWTHNCEHGVIRGVALEPIVHHDSLPKFHVLEDKQVEFGPEQLVARIPVEWNEEFDTGQSLVAFSDSLWRT